MKIVKNEKKYASKCLALARDLTEHFTPSTMKHLSADLQSDLLYAALDDVKNVTGFLCLRRVNAQAAEVTWLAVARNNWDRGPGADLLARAAGDAKGKGARLLVAKLLSPSTEYKPYEKTWSFYAKQGFIVVDTINPYPGWEPGQACAIFVKVL